MSDYKVKHDEHKPEDEVEIGEDLGMVTIWGLSLSFFFFCIAISAWLVGIFGKTAYVEKDVKVYESYNMSLQDLKLQQQASLNEYVVIDADEGKVSVPLHVAMGRAVRELMNSQRNPPVANMRIDGTEIVPFNPCGGIAEDNPCAPADAETIPEAGAVEAQH